MGRVHARIFFIGILVLAISAMMVILAVQNWDAIVTQVTTKSLTIYVKFVI
jgi:hypothetical protein